MKNIIEPVQLRELLQYDAESGRLFWRERDVSLFTDGRYAATRNAAIWNTRYAGAEAFTCASSHGYLHGTIFARHFSAHRVAWALYYGEWPQNDIDHINGIRTDNRISNLRDVTVLENRRNAAIPRSNTSGVMGVCWREAEAKWFAYIQVNRKFVNLGFHAEFSAAVDARKTAEARYGFHPNHGRAA